MRSTAVSKSRPSCGGVPAYYIIRSYLYACVPCGYCELSRITYVQNERDAIRRFVMTATPSHQCSEACRMALSFYGQSTYLYNIHNIMSYAVYI